MESVTMGHLLAVPFYDEQVKRNYFFMSGRPHFRQSRRISTLGRHFYFSYIATHISIFGHASGQLAVGLCVSTQPWPTQTVGRDSAAAACCYGC